MMGVRDWRLSILHKIMNALSLPLFSFLLLFSQGLLGPITCETMLDYLI